MTLRLSTGARNGIANSMGFARMFNRGYMEIYSGSQPLTADAAATGTKLGIVSASSGTVTKETRATGTVTVAGASGSVNTVTVAGMNIIPDGVVAFRVDANTTASDLCDAINRNGIFEARVSAAVVTIRPPYGSGDAYNAATVATTVTTLTATPANMSGAGVDPANGLLWGAPALGVISKATSQVWSFAGIAAGTAGWFRLYSPDTADTGILLSAEPWYPRMDGSIAVSGGDLNLSNISIAVSAPTTIDTFQFTVPAQ